MWFFQVSAIIGSLSDIRPPNWVLSEQYQTFVQKADSEEVQWQPDISYYIAHVRKIADSKISQCDKISKILQLITQILYFQLFPVKMFST